MRAAAELMQTEAAALDIVDGEIVRAGGAPARRCRSPSSRARWPGGLSAEDTFESAHMVYPYGVHVAAVRVDADTGGVNIERYVDRL